MAFTQLKTVLQVNIERVAVFIQHRAVAHGPVVVNLELQIRTVGERM